MMENKEISALFQLIDDPDVDVFNTVTERIISIGTGMIPHLENLWENTPEPPVQERIEMIIHQLHFRDLVKDFITWKNGSSDLLEGALLFCRYTHTTMSNAPVLQEIEKIRRNIWLELNSYLTPLEQTNIISGILFSYYNLQGGEINYFEPSEFMLNKVLDTKKGNSVSNGILYLILCEMLDIPARAVNIPRQFILGYFATSPAFTETEEVAADRISFFIDPLNGQVYSQKDVENYFKRISVHPTPAYFRSMSNKRVIQFLLEEFSNCFAAPEEESKKAEILVLAGLLDE